MARIVFFQPHPDDLELNCGQLLHFLAKKSRKNHVIKVASTTKGEFGLPGAQYDKFKGDFLAKVRTRELFNALRIHGIPPENVHFFGYIDGLVPFNREFIEKVKAYLRVEKPDIIFAPEPIYTSYYHIDHINTGRVVFYCLHNNCLGYTPKLYFYSSLSSNFYFGFRKKDLKITDQLLACHKTQFWLINKMRNYHRLKFRLTGMKLRGWKYSEKYRLVYFKQLKKNRPSLLVRMLSHWYSSMPWFEAKYPQELLKKGIKKI